MSTGVADSRTLAKTVIEKKAMRQQ